MNAPLWDEPQRTLTDMLLTEPGSRIEGPTQDVLTVVFETCEGLLEYAGVKDPAPDSLAMQLLTHIHSALTNHGYVVRQYPGED